jgi:TRAP transporter TAXI family solute receptor
MKRSRRNYFFVMALVLLICLLVSGVAFAAEKKLTFITMPMGGSYYVQAAGLSQVIQKYTDLSVTVEPVTGPKVWTPRIKSGHADLAILNARGTYESFNGIGDYKQIGKTDIAVMGFGQGSLFTFFTRPETNVKTVQDVAGKKLMYKTPGTPISAEGAELVLRYYGILDKIKELPGGSAAAKGQALIEKRTDVYWCPLGTHMLNVDASVGLVVIEIPEECGNAIHEKYPWWVSTVARKGDFGLKTDTRILEVINNFYCRRSLSEDTVYSIMKAVYDHPEDLKAIHRRAGTWTLERALRTNPIIPFHPGAIKYYKEKGLWGEALEAKQKELTSN